MNIELETMQHAAYAATDLLKALANRHRLMLLCQMTDGEKSVGQLADAIGLRASTVSQHLALLRREKLITGRRDGQMIWYSITSEPASQVIRAVCNAYCHKNELLPGGGDQMTSQQAQQAKERPDA